MSPKGLTERQAQEWMDTLTHRHDDRKLTCPHFVYMYISVKTSASLARKMYLSRSLNAVLHIATQGNGLNKCPRFQTICYHTAFQNATFTGVNIVSITRTVITVVLVTLAVRN
jgi:hypothetical protein